MSFRTIVVGLLAAVCGICATLGVMTLNSGGANSSSKTAIVVAKSSIDMGQKIKANVLETIDWNSSQLPPGAFTSMDDVVDKYSTASLAAGEVVTTARIDDNPSTLVLGEGMRAYAIEAASESTNVGGNVVAGNRVDIIWQTNGRLDNAIDPITVRLLQNVKILAVGRVQVDAVGGTAMPKSLTLEVRPKMDEDLAFAQSFGKLTLSVRNPGDNEGVEPRQLVRFKDLLTELETASKQPVAPTAWEAFSEMIGVRIAAIEQKLQTPAAKTANADRETLNRISKGMRAITIQTPNESTGLAGLLEPRDRVDLQLTVAKEIEATEQYPSETLIENIEVLAVDSKIFTADGDGERKMSRSVTLIVMESMIRDIAKASNLGTLSLTLRGTADSELGPPRVVMSVDAFVEKHLPAESVDQVGLAGILAAAPIKIRTLRGSSVQELPFVSQ